ncbi:uncharacterized protein L969DRAFT_54575 [Mixia osmundae IAM 14324]|uniref:uncharacterized protein n=1 Tax=Mixia osmundae (strain CBS 9802 / IAM 14324 / JCM 22182 / KY 12970) TaxID=764103 RepID=UPI0004A552A9|nr:uncharacterized protein L969DRAFT_54575 [Mixia osmundae IAM 14324]KEI36765.1 hypothetical protein L969DRAFT_54575 [Mixia osmundae IAM 14324]
MPFYELVCIAIHYPQYAPIKDLATGLASFVKAQGGCVRSIDYQGSRVLPTYWTMKFDANPPTLKQVRERLMNDPRVLRSPASSESSGYS